MKKITNNLIKQFREYLLNEEKAIATIEKYVHDVQKFANWLENRPLNKENVYVTNNYL